MSDDSILNVFELGMKEEAKGSGEEMTRRWKRSMSADDLMMFSSSCDVDVCKRIVHSNRRVRKA